MARKARSNSSSSLSALSMVDLQAELRRRSKFVTGLERRRERLVARLTEIDAKIRELGGSPGGSSGSSFAMGRRRPKNDANLVESLAKLLKGKTMGVTEAADAVQNAGYQTSAANFRTIVNQTLIKHRNVFKKVSRGQYTAA